MGRYEYDDKFFANFVFLFLEIERKKMLNEGVAFWPLKDTKEQDEKTLMHPSFLKNKKPLIPSSGYWIINTEMLDEDYFTIDDEEFDNYDEDLVEKINELDYSMDSKFLIVDFTSPKYVDNILCGYTDTNFFNGFEWYDKFYEDFYPEVKNLIKKGLKKEVEKYNVKL